MAVTVFEDKLTKQSLINLLHPIGSIYMSAESINPGVLFEGTTWEQICDKFLVASGSTFTAGVSGGQENVSFTPTGTIGEFTITANEMPSHSHDISHTHDNGSYVLNTTGSHKHPWVGFFGPLVTGQSRFAARDADSGGIDGDSIRSSGAHTHTISGSSGTAFIGSETTQENINTSSCGSGRAHSHDFTGNSQNISTVPPYLSVNIWKRTA